MRRDEKQDPIRSEEPAARHGEITSRQGELVARVDRTRIRVSADACLGMTPISLRDYPAPAEGVGRGDFYSMGDYWWPNPETADGLPYVKYDGRSNPENFVEHRHAVMRLRDAVAALCAAYLLFGEEKYAGKASELLRVFFVDRATRMNPHLRYAQAIPGVSSGRGIGIIDTLHLAEVAQAIEKMQYTGALGEELYSELVQWFSDYGHWMTTHPNGIEELHTHNNHAVAYLLQLAAFSRLTGNEEHLLFCREHFKEVLIPEQMAEDGSFPAELERTKPFGYSIFQLDNMCLLAQLLSIPSDNLWAFSLPDGRSIRKAVEFLYPYLYDREQWPYTRDVEHFNDWPVRQPSLLFAGYAYGERTYVELWEQLNPDPQNPEIRRNMAVTQPLLWIENI